MNDILNTLNAFMAEAHKNGSTDCATAENHLKLAKKAFASAKDKAEKKKLKKIIAELNQIHRLCIITARTVSAPEDGDGFGLGV